MDHMTGNSPVLVAFGNPLLDITAVVPDKSLHKRFNLPVDGQLEVTPEQRQLFQIVQDKYDVEQTAGGCALNSSRMFSWVLGESHKVLFIGGIGKDENAKKLEQIVHSSGVSTQFVEVEDKPTGTCVALVLGAERCLCADIGAANVCTPEHVFNSPILSYIDNAQYIYIEGYFITHSFQTAFKVAQYAQKKNKTFIFNLCGSYVCQNHPDELTKLLPYIDIMFGYVEEYKSLEKHVDLKTLLKESPNHKGKDNIVEHIWRVLQTKKENIVLDSRKPLKGTEESVNGTSNLSNGVGDESVETTKKKSPPNKSLNGENFWWKKQKLAVVTQGPKPLLYSTNKSVRQRPVIPINTEEIIDTTGAGDSFVGGFLAALSHCESLERCLDSGTWTAQHILRQKGCTLPTYPATFLT